MSQREFDRYIRDLTAFMSGCMFALVVVALMLAK